MNRIRRYLRLYKSFVRYSLARELSFRGDFFGYVFVNLLWAGFSVFVAGIYYAQTPSIAGWTIGEGLALLATWHIVNAILTFFVRRNFARLPTDIKDGLLDLVIIKPINTQFLVSLKYLDLPKIFNLLFAIGLLVFGLMTAGVHVTIGQALIYSVLVLAGSIMTYAIWFAMLTLSFRFVGMSNLEMLFDAVFRFSRFPADAFTAFGKAILFTVIPIGVAIQLPAEALARGLAWRWVIYALLVAGLALWTSTFLWKRELRRYSSASS